MRVRTLLKGISLSLRDMEYFSNFFDNLRSYRQILMKFIVAWDDVLLAKHSVLVLIQITIPIQKFLKEFLP